MRRFLILCTVLAIFTVSTPIIAVSDNSIKPAEPEKPVAADESTTQETAQTVKVFATESSKIITVEEKEYVIGSLAAEMPASYHKEALKAQAICARGFIVKRPYAFGVGSPSLTAVSAWAYTWIVEAINIDGIAKSIQYIVSDVRKFIF